MAGSLAYDIPSSRPGERRDPYAVYPRLGNVADVFRTHRHQWLWIPARAPLGRDDGWGQRGILYKIPITLSLTPSRKSMRRVAHQHSTEARRPYFSRITTHRSTLCWTSSCWPSASASLWRQWATPTPANDFSF